MTLSQKTSRRPDLYTVAVTTAVYGVIKSKHPDLLKATYPKPVTSFTCSFWPVPTPLPPFLYTLLPREETSERAGINHCRLEQDDHWGGSGLLWAH